METETAGHFGLSHYVVDRTQYICTRKGGEGGQKINGIIFLKWFIIFLLLQL
jgi:hypothetical protein